ncbi:LAQU0S03e05468g1_1 [Lachancea quebecensis]|uniref:LAQU0S03e05468g1_1 n=1 Tax=Lachancea quebecensis TaxID=1654605 RepID=A0A0P1KRN8_9SACH|nr:LAQU0S03e05468g1_1 [Lachancea quebecensis]
MGWGRDAVGSQGFVWGGTGRNAFTRTERQVNRGTKLKVFRFGIERLPYDKGAHTHTHTHTHKMTTLATLHSPALAGAVRSSVDEFYYRGSQSTCEQRCIALDGARGNQVLLPGPGLVTAAQRHVESDLKRALDRCAFGAGAASAAPVAALSAATTLPPLRLARTGSVTPHGSVSGPGSVSGSGLGARAESTSGSASASASASGSEYDSAADTLSPVAAGVSVATAPASDASSGARPGSSSSSTSSSSSRSTTGKRTRSPIEQRRRYVCKTCVKGFTTSGHLARHNRIHTGEKNHVCPHPGCGQRFSRHDNCVQHYKTHLRRNTWQDDAA